MKIQRFTEISASDYFGIPTVMHQKSMYDDDFPIKCKFHHRVPDPGICYVTDLDFREKKLHWSNGAVSSVANFEDVEFIPDLFLLTKYNI